MRKPLPGSSSLSATPTPTPGKNAATFYYLFPCAHSSYLASDFPLNCLSFCTFGETIKNYQRIQQVSDNVWTSEALFKATATPDVCYPSEPLFCSIILLANFCICSLSYSERNLMKHLCNRGKKDKNRPRISLDSISGGRKRENPTYLE